MTSSCTNCGNPPPIRVNISSEELLYNLRFKFGPSVVSTERANELRRILARAEKEIEELEGQREIILSLLSPIRKLPNETLLHVFQYVCEENILQCYPWLLPDWQPPTKLTSPIITYLPSMTISSVCSRWRALVLSSPSLWANLAVETLDTSLDEAENLVGFINTVTRYLERSGDSPLNLALTIGGSSEYHAAQVPSLIQLTEHAHCWKTFKYQGGHALAEYNLLSQLRCPLLEELDIDTIFKVFKCFEYYPRLRALSTSEPVGPTSKALYSQLNHIKFYRHQLTEMVEALRSCPSLSSLELSYIDSDLKAVAPGTWRNITSVALVKDASSHVMFSSFNFPCLNKLVVTEGYSWPAYEFSSFISRSSCMITTFTLRGTSMIDTDLIAALRVMPALLHLEVEDHLRPRYLPEYYSPVTTLLVLSLIQDHSTSLSLVPKLHSLHLTWRCGFINASDDDDSDIGFDHASDGEADHEFDNEFDDAAFVSMVESRWFKPGSDLAAEMSAMGRSSIRSVVLKFPARTADADIYGPLRILDAEGLRVVVAGTNGVQV